MANFTEQEYSNYSVYGEKSQVPSTRQNLMRFLAEDPNDPFVFLAHFGLGDFNKAIAAAEKLQVQNGVLYYAAGHKVLAELLANTVPKLDKPVVDEARSEEITPADRKICPIGDPREKCFFFETYTVHRRREPGDRLGEFLDRAPGTDKAKIRQALEASPEQLRQVVNLMTRAASLSKAQPHGDDAEYFLGLISRYLGQRSDAIAHFGAALNFPGDVFHGDYVGSARHQLIEMMLEVPDSDRLTMVRNTKGLSTEPAAWYVLARDLYRRHDYQQTINMVEEGLEKIGVEAWRLPFTTEKSRHRRRLDKTILQKAQRDCRS